MDVRLQTAMVFHLDKCIGCHTCSIACKNVWTDRRGAEYMWWNNVETKPGTGYPTRWEDQEKYKGGWVRDENGTLRMRSTSKGKSLSNIFHHPHMPSMDDYYEPWTYAYEDLFTTPEGNDQPIARPISMVTGKEMDIEAGPNWDDDLGGSPVYAENDINLDSLSEQERAQLFEIERMTFFYVPRVCNHCLNATCVAACPSGALYKRGEDGIVLINQSVCRGWRFCISACPYKKSYYNWNTGKAEKCILCFPRLEAGMAPACFHSCVGRIRYLGGLLYDASRIEEVVDVPDDMLVEAQRSIILDPFSPDVISEAKRKGIDDLSIEACQKSPVYRWVKEWKLALPLHPEHRTIPQLFYVPPLSPVMGKTGDGIYEELNHDFFTGLDEARVPIKFLAGLFGAGNEGVVRYSLKKMMAVRAHRRLETVGDGDQEAMNQLMAEIGSSPRELDEIHRMTALVDDGDRFVIPPLQREIALEMLDLEVIGEKGETGFGFREKPERGS
jgi:nitrate reductase beta subunit